MSEFTTSKKTFFDRHEVVTNNLGGQVTQSRAHAHRAAGVKMCNVCGSALRC